MNNITSLTLESLRTTYYSHLTSDIIRDEGKPGKVAGKETRRGLRQGAIWAQLTQDSWREFLACWENTPEDILVWSDLHIGHENIIRYTKRPYISLADMDEKLLTAAKQNILPHQWVLFVGDVAIWKDHDYIASWLKECPGRKALILGNHDVHGPERPRRIEQWQDLGFEAVSDCLVIPQAHGVPTLWTTHYPLPADKIPENSLNLHGHTHQLILSGPLVSACVELIGYQPIPLKKLILDNLKA